MIPNGYIKFYNFTSIIGYSDQIYFKDRQAQIDFFNQRTNFSISNYQFMRANFSIRIESNFYDCLNLNYCSYFNSNFSIKEIYCFIDDIVYINDVTTEIQLRVDAWQTFMFDVEWVEQTFIEQAFPLDDNIRNEVIALRNPEGLSVGEWQSYDNINHFYEDNMVMFLASVDLTKSFGVMDKPRISSSVGGIIDRVPSALDYYVMEMGDFYDLLSYMSDFPWILQTFSSLTIVPRDTIGSQITQISINGGLFTGVPVYRLNQNFISLSPNSIDLYPLFKEAVQYVINAVKGSYVNRKLLTSQFLYILAQNYSGDMQILSFENFNLDYYDSSITYDSYGYANKMKVGFQNHVSYAPSILAVPQNYNINEGFLIRTSVPDKNINSDLSVGINMNNFPQFPIAIDNYALFMANNANRINANMGNIESNFNLSERTRDRNKQLQYYKQIGLALDTADKAVGNLMDANPLGAVANVAGGVVSGIMSQATFNVNNRQNLDESLVSRKNAIRSMVGIQEDTKLIPDTLVGQSGGNSFNLANGFFGFSFILKVGREEFYNNCNKFFNRFGYNILKEDYVPKYLSIRKNNNYIKTNGVVVKPSSSVPNFAVNLINNMFMSGVQLWNGINPNSVGFDNNPPL